MEEKIIKLLTKGDHDDLIIGLEILIRNFDKSEIIQIFENHSGKWMDQYYRVKARLLCNRPTQPKNWIYYYNNEIGFFVSVNEIHLCDHPATYSNQWPNIEL